jgi:hypothetical protein
VGWGGVKEEVAIRAHVLNSGATIHVDYMHQYLSKIMN